MPRLSRTVFAGVPHHITQRGNRREDTFFTDEDCKAYLSWLKEYSEEFHVEILAYCLMTNHIHLVAVPTTDEGLHRMLKPLHMRYAQRINRARGWKGHLWQGRFFFITPGRCLPMGGGALCGAQPCARRDEASRRVIPMVERSRALRQSDRWLAESRLQLEQAIFGGGGLVGLARRRG